MESEWVFQIESNRWFRSIYSHTGEPCWEWDSLGGSVPRTTRDDEVANLAQHEHGRSGSPFVPKDIYAHSTPSMSSQTRHTSLSDLQPQPAFEDRICTDSSKMNIGHQFSEIEGTYLPGIHRAGDSMYPAADFLAGSSASSPPEWFQPEVQYEIPQEATHRGTGCTGISGRSKATKLSTSDASMLQSHPNDFQESALDASNMASGSNSEHETLDPRYKKQRDPRSFFRVGRVFSMLWHENAGSNGNRHSKKVSPRSSSQFIRGKYQEPIYSSIRRMIVVKQQRGCCWCVPIITYGGQGVAKAGIDRSKHAVIYMRGDMPPAKEDEPAMTKQPLEVEPVRLEQKLDPMSRVNFGKVYTVEHNVKVLPQNVTMKRKLDANDVPAPKAKVAEDKDLDFEALNLDPRLRQALIKEKFTKPTLVQSKAIPLALEGKDILARAKTGSGKTAAYVLPILQAILQQKTADPSSNATTALILVPTRELAEQVQKVIVSFSSFCGKDIRSVNLTQKVSDEVQRSMLADFPDIVVSTPTRVYSNVNNSALSLDKVTHLVIDEADLVLSYGYDDDINALSKAIPRGAQTFLMSATLTSEVDTLKDLYCRNPVILKLEEKEEKGAGVSQFVVKCAEDEKFLLTYVIFKLQLIKGKVIIFVADVDRCYRVKLFLEQFGLKSCVLNSELPINSRIHVVEEFNKGIYDIIIAADEQEVLGTKSKKTPEVKELEEAEPKEEMGESEDEEAQEETGKGKKPESKKRRKMSAKEKDFSIARGIDFQDVACVLNFDLPTTSKSYTHRIGRTGRAGKAGMALSFVVPADQYGKHRPTSIPSTKHDESMLAKIVKRQAKLGHEVKPYHFEMSQVDAFRYRMTDALRAVTRLAIQEARGREIRQELIKSEKLKRHFEDNPDELRQLRHDGELRAARVQAHLKHVPEYLMPAKGRKGISKENVGYVSFSKSKQNRIRKARDRNRARGKSGGKSDPLKTFNRSKK
ncbi:unnamed protein product [Penicillium salamii]|uniref:RNA helicase n=1 Tax=Penicillium salamii TaxID=1612424 RepID=A0A9W4IQ40_9EURO|nr:unnamed protein product [Penicillium salamii]